MACWMHLSLVLYRFVYLWIAHVAFWTTFWEASSRLVILPLSWSHVQFAESSLVATRDQKVPGNRMDTVRVLSLPIC